MSVDHDRLDNKIKKYSTEKLVDIERAESIFLSFKSELERHIIWEEDILFPVFERKTGIKDGGPTSVMRIEHIEIKKYLQEIKRKLHVKKIQDPCKEEVALFKVLESHNQKEENILYPGIDKLTSEQEKEQMIKQMSAIK
ncbi:MAG TPA: hemerythrin domain-containing protein [Pelagibacteraceae bacterium]|jgi:iron-sulfur cluster repair protein YtfE (RIC family)|nr:hemerythrin domain-containing protein [Pelagibacteraceae bacterium]